MRLVTFGHDGTRFTTPWLPALDSEQTLVLVLGAPQKSPDLEPFRELRDAYPRARFLGGAHGAGSSRAHDGADPLTIAVARFESTWLRSASVPLDGAADSHAAGAALARQLVAPRLRGVLVLAGGGGLCEGELARGLREGLPTVAASGFLSGVDVAGGSWLLHDGAPVRALAAAIGFYGDDCCFESTGGATLISESGDAATLALLAAGEPKQELPSGSLSIPVTAAATFVVAASNGVASPAAIAT